MRLAEMANKRERERECVVMSCFHRLRSCDEEVIPSGGMAWSSLSHHCIGPAPAPGLAMVNILLVIRSALALLGASLSLFNINGWLTVMLGPDCWNYSAKELGVKAVQETTDNVGYKIGVDAATLTAPLAQSLRYAVSGVGVHLAFIGLVVLYLAIVTPHASRLHVQVPFALLLLDLLTLVNATGLIDPNTAGHPRCATVSTSECAGALSTFLPVVILDATATLLASTGVYPSAKKPKAG